ncbi:hypothetical protein [Mesorhizobium sp. NZP2298]|uniref:hypothetical protein n=1 Tax=Mesorhizobium sp. NZP2298 TaxID=2483403 RepID=UPI001FED6350|nr:hypothetical protein [Mesorhizobium sp. NZP2298]
MTLQGRTPLGFFELDEGLPLHGPSFAPRENSPLNPATFDRPIVTEMVVEGALAEAVIRGDPSIEGACVAAAQRLVERGAGMITSDWGCLIRHQAASGGGTGGYVEPAHYSGIAASASPCAKTRGDNG